MATTDKIIDSMFRAIGERNPSTPTKPVISTRAEMLAILNQAYQNDIGEQLKNNIASYSYDASDSAHTITAGVGALPSDFLLPSRFYDGDAPAQSPLQQIFDINDKVADDAATSQYMIAGNQVWLFGKTPANTPKLYYIKKPTALTDLSTSSPLDLKEKFHVKPFEYLAKMVYAMRQNKTADMFDMEAGWQDLLVEIKAAHTIGMRDDAPAIIKQMY